MSKKKVPSDKVLRFKRSERHVHWAISIPFMVCYGTALILVIVYGPNPEWPFREVVSWIHRISGVCLFLLPLIVMFRTRHDLKTYFDLFLDSVVNS